MSTQPGQTLDAQKQNEFAAKALEAEKKYGLGEPIAIIRIYQDGDFLIGGTADRDHEEVSKTLIRISLAELEIKDRRGKA